MIYPSEYEPSGKCPNSKIGFKSQLLYLLWGIFWGQLYISLSLSSPFCYKEKNNGSCLLELLNGLNLRMHTKNLSGTKKTPHIHWQLSSTRCALKNVRTGARQQTMTTVFTLCCLK